MHILKSLAALTPATYPKPVVALGNFDGVHLGHQAIFRHVVTRAQDIGGTSMVFTFDPHPLQVLAPDKAPKFLTTSAQRMQLMARTGLAVCLQVPFTEAFARQQPIEFVRDILWRRIGVYELVVGYDFRFGYQRAGTVAFLQEQATTFGYQVTVTPAVKQGDTVISSSHIRQLLQQGHVEAAARLLGRYYTITGTVVEGFRRGTQIGFPTANIRSDNDIIPQTGVYVVRVEWENRQHPGVANVGYSPTFGNCQLSVEVHLFDFQACLYGATVAVEFLTKLRDERRFASVSELVTQIAADAQQARQVHADLLARL